MKRKIVISLSLVLMLITFIMPSFSHASGIPFDVKPILPDNQEPNITSYISIKPDSKSLDQNLEFTIKNNESKEKEIEINVVNAYTSPNGVVQYVKKEQENSRIVDDSYKLTNYLSLEGDNKITLKGNEERKIVTKLNVDELDGVVLGGVSFKTVSEGKVKEQENASFQINNEINMVIGVMIDFGTDKKVAINIGDPYVDPMPAYYAVRLPVSLETPLFKELKLDYKVLHKDKELFSNKSKYDFAPMTETNIALAWEHEEIKPNTPYILKGVFTYKDIDGKEKTLEFEKEFIFKDEKQENVFASLTTPIVEGNFPYWLVALAVLLTLLVVYYVRKRANTYVLFSDEEAPRTISNDHELYSIVQKKKDALNRGNAKNMHIYTKKKLSKTKEIYYAYKKTKKLDE